MTLDNRREALRNLQAEGLSETSLTVLVNDDPRPDIAKAVHICLDEVVLLTSG
jgi:hypothetical protein